jgi:hypothetical protein
VLKCRVRTTGLTEGWEIDLPQMPLSFEFDPRLSVEALYALADAPRGEAIAQAVRLDAPAEGDAANPPFLELNDVLALRHPPEVVVAAPLPCDLAHAIVLEFEGIPGRWPAGGLVLSGQGERGGDGRGMHRFSIGPVERLTATALETPGCYRLRVVLEPDADRGWADPEVRSIWPEAIVTNWVEVEAVRQ